MRYLINVLTYLLTTHMLIVMIWCYRRYNI